MFIMKGLEDYSQTELAKLNEEEINNLIDIECAFKGVRLLPKALAMRTIKKSFCLLLPLMTNNEFHELSIFMYKIANRLEKESYSYRKEDDNNNLCISK